MTSNATPPKLQFFDANGAPLVGGKLYTYAAGTTTPQASYTDYGGGTPNTNPVILDSRGEASVWLGTALYKMALYSATNVLIWTVDNIGGFATLAQLAASGGSNLIGFLQAGTGAVATTVQTKLRESVSVKDFGADATGVIDSYPAFLAAYNSGASRIYIPQGNYRQTQTLVMDRAVTIYGETSAGTRDFLPSNTSLITFTGGGAAFSFTGSDVNGTRNFHIRDLSIVGTASGTCGILLGTFATGFATMGSVINVQIKGFTAVGACGLWAQYALNFYFRNVSCFGNYDGVKIQGVNTTLTFESCWSTGNSNYGWFLNSTFVGGTFIKCIAESSGKQGLYITGYVSTCDFYSWHSEVNCVTSGVAPNIITTDGTTAPIYINFYGGYFGDYVGAGYLVFYVFGAGYISWNNIVMQSYGPGFMQVDGTTFNCSFTTWSDSVLATSIVNNTNRQVVVNHGIVTAKGNTGSIADATATTIFTASTVGMYTVVARLVAGVGAPSLYMASAEVLFDGTSSTIFANNGTKLVLSLSGNAIQVTQTSGGPQATGVNWSSDFQYLT